MRNKWVLGSRQRPGTLELYGALQVSHKSAERAMDEGGDPSQFYQLAQDIADLSAHCRVFFQLNGLDGAPWVLEREKYRYWKLLEQHEQELEDKDDSNVVTPKPFTKLEKLLGAGGELHQQTFWAWRVYPRAIIHSLSLGMMVGSFVGCMMLTLFQLMFDFP